MMPRRSVCGVHMVTELQGTDCIYFRFCRNNAVFAGELIGNHALGSVILRSASNLGLRECKHTSSARCRHPVNKIIS